MSKYRKMETGEYEFHFGIYPSDKKRRKTAWKKAWEARNYEIDKFWLRAAYFWGFIALIGTGYIAVVTGKNASIILPLGLFLSCLGVVASWAWVLVIKGSRQWQENWEEHIYMLEDSITGPLYKTVYKSKKPFYSVSGISKLLAKFIFAAWCLLALFHLTLYICKKKIICTTDFRFFAVTILLVATIVAIFILCRYGKSKGINKVCKDDQGAFLMNIDAVRAATQNRHVLIMMDAGSVRRLFIKLCRKKRKLKR